MKPRGRVNTVVSVLINLSYSPILHFDRLGIVCICFDSSLSDPGSVGRIVGTDHLGILPLLRERAKRNKDFNVLKR